MSSSLKILGPVTLQELCMISLVCRWYYQCGHSGEQYFPNDKKVFIDNAFVTEQLNQGRIQDFKLGGGGAVKKIAPSGGRREIFGVFRVKNHHFKQKNDIFSNFRGKRTWCAPWILP
jgi:hypothetical protein